VGERDHRSGEVHVHPLSSPPVESYGDETVIDYFDRMSIYDADWLTAFTIVDDPKYLNQPFITSTHFKREANRSKWMPTPCTGG